MESISAWKINIALDARSVQTVKYYILRARPQLILDL